MFLCCRGAIINKNAVAYLELFDHSLIIDRMEEGYPSIFTFCVCVKITIPTGHMLIKTNGARAEVEGPQLGVDLVAS